MGVVDEVKGRVEAAVEFEQSGLASGQSRAKPIAAAITTVPAHVGRLPTPSAPGIAVSRHADHYSTASLTSSHGRSSQATESEFEASSFFGTRP